MRKIDFKTSVAVELSGLEVTAKRLQELIGREKPKGQHHMRYTPTDLRVARYRLAGLSMEDIENASNLFEAIKVPPTIITRMTKGGVGKTSSAVNLASAMAMMGFRILVIDGDPQASASNLLLGNTDTAPVTKHIGHFLLAKTDGPDPALKDAIIPIYEGGFLDLLPSDITLAESDANMVAALNSHERALRFFNRNREFLGRNYDAIVVDTAPGTTPIGLAFTYAAKTAGRVVAIVEPVGDCLRALESLASNLHELKAATDADISMEIVINKFHPSLKHVKDNMGVLYTKYGTYLNDTIVPQFSGFARQMDPDNKDSRPLVESDPTSIGARALIQIAQSMVKSFGITHPGLTMTVQQKAA